MDHEPIIIVIVVVVTRAQYKVLFFLLSVAETERRSVEDDLEHSANPLNFYFLVSMQTSLDKTDDKVYVLKWFCSLAVLKTKEISTSRDNGAGFLCCKIVRKLYSH